MKQSITPTREENVNMTIEPEGRSNAARRAARSRAYNQAQRRLTELEAQRVEELQWIAANGETPEAKARLDEIHYLIHLVRTSVR
jgi:hypothetical protein